MGTTTTTKQSCYHCGDPCDEIIQDQAGHSFCCNGCHTVYSLLSDAQLDGYYQLNSAPGSKQPTAQDLQFIEALSLPDVQSRLLEFKEGDHCRVTFTIPAIHCSSCVWLLERLPQLQQGIQRSTVNFTTRLLHINYDQSKVSLADIVQLLQKIGYQPQFDTDKNRKSASSEHKQLLLKLAVAGFCFGNVMFLYFPQYFNVVEVTDPALATFFRYLSLAFAIPVLSFSAVPFLKGAWSGLKSKSVNIDIPISAGILVLFFRSVVEVVQQVGPGYLDSLCGLVFFLLLGRWYQARTYRTLSFEKDAGSYLPLSARRMTNDSSEIIDVKQVANGDVLQIRNGDMLPVDCELMSANAYIDYAFVTGESDRLKKQITDRLFAGGRHYGPIIEVKATADYDSSYLVQLWDEAASARTAKSGVSQLLDKVSKYFTIVVITIALVSFAIWSFVDPAKGLDALTAVLIVACPCALALSTPFVFGTVMRLFGQRGLYLKSSHVVERLASVTDVVYDKTGTLTHGQDQQVNWEGASLSETEKYLIKSVVVQSQHPNSLAIAAALQQSDIKAIAEFEELSGHGISALVSGHHIRIGSGEWLDQSSHASNSSWVEIDGHVKGCFVVTRRLRTELSDALAYDAGTFQQHMVSGDHEDPAVMQLGAFEPARVVFEAKPEDKVAYIEQLQNAGKTVLMAGDGMNDAPALSKADVGVAVAEQQFQFTPSADAIITGENVKNLGQNLRLAQRSLKLVWWCIGVSFLYNMVGLFFAVQALLSPVFAAILMPLSSVTIVAMATLGSRWVFRGQK